VQEDGWVVCRVFKKKSIQRSFEQPGMAAGDEEEVQALTPVDQKQGLHHQLMHGGFPFFDTSMHLPQLASPGDATLGSGAPAFMSGTPAAATNPMGMGCTFQYMAKLTSALAGGNTGEIVLNSGVGNRFGTAADWSILDKLLASHQNLDQLFQGKLEAPHHYQQQQLLPMQMGASPLQGLPLHYLGCEAADLLKFSM
jgi:hypothetical protein